MSKLSRRLLVLLILIPFGVTGCIDGNITLGIITALAVAAAASKGGGSSDSSTTTTTTPVTNKTYSEQSYDGSTDDLLTAGLGQSGLSSQPAITDSTNPTVAELRRAAIANQYQNTVDMRTRSGYGTLYGAAVAGKFSNPSSDGKVPGKEYITYVDDGSGKKNVILMVQVPSSFSRTNPCIVATASPEARGIYGAIAQAGEWGLKNGCAVAYTDKGAGIGEHDLFTDTVNTRDGSRTTSTNAAKLTHFSAQGTSQLDLAGYNALYPYRAALKHAHSQQNPEADWGSNVLSSVQFAFQILNLSVTDSLGNASTLNANNTIVIAAGMSTGGTAVLKAAEQDSNGLIDGVVAAAPVLNVRNSSSLQSFSIRQGTQTFANSVYNKTLFDVWTYYNLYHPCASASDGTFSGFTGRCTVLRNSGLLTSDTLLGQITEAQKKLNDYGALSSSNTIANMYGASDLYTSYAHGFASAYGKFSVVDNLCGYSYAGLNANQPAQRTLATLSKDYQVSNGLAGSGSVGLVNNQLGVSVRMSTDTSSSNGLDYFTQGALCLRNLAVTAGSLVNSSGGLIVNSDSNNVNRVQSGLQQVLPTANLLGKPTLILQGRDDALAPANFSGRFYFGLNQATQGTGSKVAYIEVKNAHHFDVLNQRYNIDTEVPMQYYFHQALDKMYDTLKNKATLPSSQVLPTKPLSSTPTNSTLVKETNLPSIGSSNACSITFSNSVLNIPEC
ncbi:MAG: 3-hydroxybutyrate oligomer hydrolase family protein [Thiotrichaceae bacterium]|nr:3-hydroxybutyrate oligomer hydrolase family protein [Thiotrichaceae bacterium]